jgi:hypothetical protein
VIVVSGSKIVVEDTEAYLPRLMTYVEDGGRAVCFERVDECLELMGEENS